MAKDIVISGSTFAGVEQVKFQTASGGTAAFVDAECNGVILHEVKLTIIPGKIVAIGSFSRLHGSLSLADIPIGVTN